MKGRLPTAALTLAQVPDADAPSRDIIHFATSMNGYVAVGGEAANLGRYIRRFEGEPLEHLGLDDLRILLFARQRAHYSQGGAWPGEPDTTMDEMRAITAEIRRRVEARGPGLAVWRGDITTLAVDAIANAANERLAGGSGVDGAIHSAAGPKLREACLAVPEVRPGVRCPTGGARITPGFKLPASFVIHAVGPVWKGGDHNERELLTSAYHNSLDLAAEHDIDTIAFPAISTGVYGYPPFEAAMAAIETIKVFQETHARPARVVLVAYDEQAERTWRQALNRIG